VYVDSVTFSDGALTDIEFTTALKGLMVNQWNNPQEGSAVTWLGGE